MDMNHDAQRNRRRRSGASSVGTIATAAVVAYGSYRLLNWAWNSWNDDLDNDDNQSPSPIGDTVRRMLQQPLNYGMRLKSQKQQQQEVWRLRRQRIQRCRAEVVKALTDFLPTMRRAIEELTDTTTETRELKSIRAEKLNAEGGDAQSEQERELWDQIKVKTVTRMMATAYTHTILFLVLTVQVHVIGGRLFEEQTNQSTREAGIDSSDASFGDRSSESSAAGDRMQSYQSSHRLVLTGTYDYFFDRGIGYLVQTIERAVAEVMQDWDVMDPLYMNVSREELNDAIHQIRDIVEGRASGSRVRRGRPSRRIRQRSMVRFLLPPEQGMGQVMEDDLARSILDETWDLLESPVLDDAHRDCLQVTFDLMRSQQWETIFQESSGFASSQWTTKPLANVISQLRHGTNSFYAGSTEMSMSIGAHQQVDSNIYCPALEQIPTVLELGDVSFN